MNVTLPFVHALPWPALSKVRTWKTLSLAKLLLCVGIFFSGLCQLWVQGQVQSMRIAYAKELQSQHHLAKAQNRLILMASQLGAPEQIEKTARAHLHMAPAVLKHR